ncbi:Hypothetical predicted protein, partial [Xyrichtys novacula]
SDLAPVRGFAQICECTATSDERKPRRSDCKHSPEKSPSTFSGQKWKNLD